MENPETLHRKIAQLYQLLGEKDAEINTLKEKLLAQSPPPKDDERAKMDSLREFLGDLTHDIRTPISVMKTSLYIIKRNPDKQNHHLNVLQKQTDHLENLIDDLVSILRLDAGLTQISSRRVNANDLVSEIAESLLPLATEKGLNLSTQTQADLPPMLADPSKITKAIHQVVENAINYTPTGGWVRLKTERQDKYIQICIQDNGIGIHEKDLPHIFERFYRADKARNTQTGSVGLGLSIAKSIIERHQGEIKVSSSEGEGTCVQILLPALLVSSPQ